MALARELRIEQQDTDGARTMKRLSPLNLLLFTATLALSALGCQSGGVGDPCTPEDEYRQSFNGYAMTEVNVESKSFQCETRVCIVNHFQGRVSCPYGQGGPPGTPMLPDIVSPTSPDYKAPSDSARCRIPGTNGKHCLDANGADVDCDNPASVQNIDEITVAVDSQRIYRNAQDTVYCSCRCTGPDPAAKYCECPSGYSCEPLVRELGLPGKAELAGSYCVKNGTVYDPQGTVPANTCYTEAQAIAQTGAPMQHKYDVQQVCGPLGKNP
jgi:hypothetical protein